MFCLLTKSEEILDTKLVPISRTYAPELSSKFLRLTTPIFEVLPPANESQAVDVQAWARVAVVAGDKYRVISPVELGVPLKRTSM